MSATTMARAKGRWREILPALGIPMQALNREHQPCPMCGGRDRFRWTDRNRDGCYYCNGCGAGSGIDMLMRYHGWSFAEAAGKVDEIIGRKPDSAQVKHADPTVEGRRANLNRLWRSGRPITFDDPVGRYLNRRCGITTFPPALRYVEALRHFEPPWDDWPAMIALVVGLDGKPVTLHRTYLTPDGDKAPVNPRGMMPHTFERLPEGSSVRLAEHGDTLGVAEGIETALSASARFGIPVWSTVNAGLLKQWRAPAGLRRVVIFGDNDKTGTGQAAAWELKRRLTVVEKIPEVEVEIYPVPGGDWNDPLAA
jgi:putative DNA primase/helicase